MTGLWVGMSLATDLIWHFHPALVGILAGWGYRRGLHRSGRRGEAAALVAVTAALVAAGGIAIAAGNKSLDPGWFVALVAAAGLGVGLRVLARA